MKRAFTILSLMLLVLYGRESYHVYQDVFKYKERITGRLSDIAREVRAIPLQPADGQCVTGVRNIRCEGNDMFLISEDALYRYRKDGSYVCRITRQEDIRVAEYLIDPLRQELIVLGNVDDVLYYNFDGELTGRKKLEGGFPDRRILALSLHHDRILAMEENSRLSPDTQEVFVEKELVTYDTSFQRLGAYKLNPANLRQSQSLFHLSQPQLYIDSDTGQVVAYTPSVAPDRLLQDTLLLASSWEQVMQTAKDAQSVPVVPVRPVGRYWFSSYTQAEDETMNYTFCYDTRSHTHSLLAEGFKDDFYDTGVIRNLQAMDLYNHAFCFARSGEAIKKAFPENGGNAVVFIVSV